MLHKVPGYFCESRAATEVHTAHDQRYKSQVQDTGQADDHQYLREY